MFETESLRVEQNAVSEKDTNAQSLWVGLLRSMQLSLGRSISTTGVEIHTLQSGFAGTNMRNANRSNVPKFLMFM